MDELRQDLGRVSQELGKFQVSFFQWKNEVNGRLSVLEGREILDVRLARLEDVVSGQVSLYATLIQNLNGVLERIKAFEKEKEEQKTEIALPISVSKPYIPKNPWNKWGIFS